VRFVDEQVVAAALLEAQTSVFSGLIEGVVESFFGVGDRDFLTDSRVSIVVRCS